MMTSITHRYYFFSFSKHRRELNDMRRTVIDRFMTNAGDTREDHPRRRTRDIPPIRLGCDECTTARHATRATPTHPHPTRRWDRHTTRRSLREDRPPTHRTKSSPLLSVRISYDTHHHFVRELACSLRTKIRRPPRRAIHLRSHRRIIRTVNTPTDDDDVRTVFDRCFRSVVRLAETITRAT